VKHGDAERHYEGAQGIAGPAEDIFTGRHGEFKSSRAPTAVRRFSRSEAVEGKPGAQTVAQSPCLARLFSNPQSFLLTLGDTAKSLHHRIKLREVNDERFLEHPEYDHTQLQRSIPDIAIYCYRIPTCDVWSPVPLQKAGMVSFEPAVTEMKLSSVN
jgi:hypothetical protein